MVVTLMDMKDYVAIAFSVIFLIATNAFLILTATKDPATIPMREFLQKTYENKLDIVYEESRQKYLDVINARVTKIKYCPTCDIYRPPRTVHCGICNCCIERLDHHCPWLGTCVGKRNYKYFIVFISLVAVLVIKGIILTIVHIANEDYNALTVLDSGKFEKTLSNKQVISVVILALTSILGIFVFWLLGYH